MLAAALSVLRRHGPLPLERTTSEERFGEAVPNTKSAAKRLRQNHKRRIRNKAARSRLRTAIKKVRSASKPEEAAEAFRKAAKLIDRAASRGMMHRNRASRSKSRLAVHVRKAGGTV
jgi:small subunit ribosomal protein S20